MAQERLSRLGTRKSGGYKRPGLSEAIQDFKIHLLGKGDEYEHQAHDLLALQGPAAANNNAEALAETPLTHRLTQTYTTSMR
jgi:hypothetical protein